MLDVTLSREVLLTALKSVGKVVPTRTTLPVLSCVVLDTFQAGNLQITGTDLDNRLTLDVPTPEDTGKGVAVVNAKALTDLLKSFPKKQAVRVLEIKGAVVVSSGSASAKLLTIPAEEFPTHGTLTKTGQEKVTLKSADLAGILALAAPFASTEESRPILNGTLLQIGGGKLKAVATNGHRLSLASVPAKTPKGPLEIALILLEGATDVLTEVALPEKLTLQWGKDYARFEGDGFSLITRLIDGPYPHYERVIPRENDKSLVVSHADITGVVGRMNAVLKASQTKRLKFDLNGSCDISAKMPDTGDVTEGIAEFAYKGDPIVIGFNAQYLASMLKVLDTPKVRFTFSKSERAAVITPEAQGDIEHMMLLMPLRLLD